MKSSDFFQLFKNVKPFLALRPLQKQVGLDLADPWSMALKEEKSCKMSAAAEFPLALLCYAAIRKECYKLGGMKFQSLLHSQSVFHLFKAHSLGSG